VRPCDRAAAGITDHAGEIADDEDGLMAEILELSEFPQDHGVAEMDIGAGGSTPNFTRNGRRVRVFRAAHAR